MNITHESVHQSIGQTRSTISKRIDTSARQKYVYIKESISQMYITKTTNLE